MDRYIKIIFILLVLYIIGSDRIKAANSDICLNGLWSFNIDPYNQGIDERWFDEFVDFSTWNEIKVPYNWDLQNHFADYAGKAWYSRTFFISNSLSEKMIRVFFESVYNDAFVWINGQMVGENHLGFLSFYFEIDEYLRFGEENRITVLVDNTFKRGAMWNWGGIRRSVSLEVTEKERLEYMHITAIPNLDNGYADINVKFELSNNSIFDQSLQYELVILNKDNEIIYKEADSTELAAREKKELTTSFSISKRNVNLWHFESPYLYDCNIRLLKDGEQIHELKDRFGIRKIEIQGEAFLLNGEPIKTVGFNLVPEDRMTGNTLPMWRIMEDVDLMKSMGANMARLSHQPLPKDFLDYLDEKGIMTFEEVALWGKDEMVDPNHPVPKEWLCRMISEKFNHPSIIGWSVGNEIGYPSMNPMVKEYVKSAIKHSKLLDNTRLAVYVTNSAHINKDDATVFSDVIMLNRYKNWGEDAVKSNTNYPGKPIFYSEFGDQITSEDPNIGIIDITNMLSQIRDKPYIVGASYWTFNDYKSSYSGTPPSGNRSWGVVTTTRDKKRAYYQFRKEYAPVAEMRLTDRNSVTIIARKEGDIPSYILEGYKIIWQGFNAENELIDAGFHNLKTISPGDQSTNIRLDWKGNLEKIKKIKLSLITGLDYSVADTIVFFGTPESPQVLKIHTDMKSARVIFEQSPFATSWKIRYTDHEGVVRDTEETINNFIEVPNLKFNWKYQMELIALNNYGESKSSSFEVITTNNEKPPIIWAAVCDETACNISFSSSEQDYTYQIQYRDVRSKYDNEKYLQLPNKGMIKIERLKEDTQYFLRIRRLMEWGFASEWSHEIGIKTMQKDKPESPIPLGVIKGKRGCLLIFNPPAKSDGYIVYIKDENNNVSNRINIRGSRLNFISLDSEFSESRFSFSIASTLKGKESEIRKFKN